AADPHHRNTVYHLLPARERNRKWLYAGRLDKDTEGLLLFVNSGDLVHRLTHPSFKIEKHYLVEIAGRITGSQLGQLTRGLEIDGRQMRVDHVRRLSSAGEGTALEVVLHQGEKRQIRRMFERLGCEVTYLRRTAFGPLTLGTLSPGQCRRLSAGEMNMLLEAVGYRPG
ncbi:MAG: pseudouridine synthase, partial [Candidatus Glassbacteria bacterium]